MASRPLIAVYDINTGAVTEKQIPLPAVFTAPIRLDIVNFVHTNLNKNRRQPRGVDPQAGMKHSAESWGTGRAVSRIPRVSGSGTHRSGQAAFGNLCRKGRMFAPLHIWRRWYRRVNIKQKRHAVASAIAASGVVPLVLARGHRISNIAELPLVIDDKFESISKTKKAVQILKRLGAYDDVKRVIRGKKIRAGKGKLRNRRYTEKKGPLVIVGNENVDLQLALRNVPGVDIANVNRLNLLTLAPGGQLGRFVIWTASAFSQLNQIFGTYRYPGLEKHGYHLNRPSLANADIARIINSNEIQTAIRPAIDQDKTKLRKKNALSNRKAEEWLNPYAKVQREVARKANEDGKKRREEALKAHRTVLSKDQKKKLNERKKASRKWIQTLRVLEGEATKKSLGEEALFKAQGDQKIGAVDDE